MKIINKLTLRHLKKNKRRTLVTIIGVVISVAMLTAVATLGVSFMSLLQQQEIADNGEWHVLYKNVNEDQLAKIHADQNTKSVMLSRDEGYAILEGSENDYKPYLFLRAYNSNGFDHFPIKLIRGKMPANENELLISAHIATNAGVDYAIGDQLTLEVGERAVTDKDEYLDQSRPLRRREDEAMAANGDDVIASETTEEDVSGETLSNTETKQFTIVGIMERPMWEPITAPGYTVLTHLPENYLANSETINVSVIWQKVNRSAANDAEQLGKTLKIGEYSLNSSLLRYYGLINDSHIRKTFFSLMAIIMSVIVIGSVSLIYNAFAISVSERSRHLGMLSSVGATKKQKRNSVFFEGAVIGLISIPLGVISGLVGIGITFYFINPLLQDSLGMVERLRVIITPLSLIAACAVSLLTIFISTYLPAKRASRVSAIDAIRQTMDVKTSGKKLRTSRLVRKIFGIEAEFGLKNLKRNKGRYSIVVFSLVVSIVLFLTVSFFTDQIRKTAAYTQSGLNYDIRMSSLIRDGSEHSFSDEFIHSVTSLEEISDYSFVQEIGVSIETSLSEDQVPDQLKQFVGNGKYDSYINMHVLEQAKLQEYAEAIKVDYTDLIKEDKMTGIIINRAVTHGEKRGESIAIKMDPGDSLELSYDDWQADTQIPLGDLEVVALANKLPLGVEVGYQGSLNMIISEETLAQLNKDNLITEATFALYLTSSDPLAVHE